MNKPRRRYTEATVPCQMAGWKKTEAMLLLRGQAEETLHGGHGAMSDGGLEEHRGNAAAP